MEFKINNKKKILNLGFLEKGFYKDNYSNRKLGRVGMPYKTSNKKENNKEEKRVDISKLKNPKLISISKKSEIIKTATNSQIDSFIDKMGLDIDKSKTLAEKKCQLVKEIIDYAELEGTNKEIGSSIDEILEDSDGFEPELAHKDKLNKIISDIDIFKDIKEFILNKFIKDNDYKIDLKSSIEDKKRGIVDTIIKTSELKGTNKEVSEQLQEILEEGFSEL